jgi:hypothetical protein
MLLSIMDRVVPSRSAMSGLFLSLQPTKHCVNERETSGMMAETLDQEVEEKPEEKPTEKPEDWNTSAIH